MQKSFSVPVKIYLAVCTALCWFAILLQLFLIIISRRLGIMATIIQFFSYFTILTNILVAICVSTLLLRQATNGFFTKPKTLTAAAVYIAIVGIIYNAVLRQLWKPEGWQLLTDHLLHTVIPVAFVLYWLFTVPKKALKWTDMFSWLIYPFLYLVYILIRGTITNLYPYPFVDVATYGYAKVLANSVWVMIGFILISLLFIGIGKVMAKLAFSR